MKGKPSGIIASRNGVTLLLLPNVSSYLKYLVFGDVDFSEDLETH